MKKKRVIYFYVGRSTFVIKDIEILSKKYEVVEFNFSIDSKWKIFLRIIQQFFFLFRYGFSSKAIISQFAGYHSFLPVIFSKIFGKKSLVICGGTDCVAFPSIGYGNFQKKFLKLFTKMSLQKATHISPKHQSLWFFDYSYTKTDYPSQGIKYFIPEIKTPYTVIANGYDGDKFKNISVEKKNIFLTVTGAMEYSFQPILKGLDLIIEIAKHFPESSFVIVGVLSASQFGEGPPNVIFLPPQPNEKLIQLYSDAKYYLQLSMAEGFPNALCEAMLCECVPIGSNVFSIPEIIGPSGFILKERRSEELVKIIQAAIDSDNVILGKMARQRILDNYTLQKREELLTALLNKIISGD